jgi:glycosyltransferase involved in cell wall biosynthesis
MNTIQEKKNLYLYIINTTDEPNNVVLGHASFAKEAGFTPVFVFPYRESSESFEKFYTNFDTLRLNFVFKSSNSYEYAVSILRLFIHSTKALLFKTKAKEILAVDLTGTLACLLLKVRGANLVALVNDNFSARYALAPFAYKILRFIENLAYKYLCSTCIFPAESRYVLLGSPKLKSVKFIPNILHDTYAPKYVGNISPKLKVLFCGWLAKSRGVELISEILLNTEPNVEILLVGNGDSALISELVKSERVTYQEHVSRKEMLEIMSEVDINIAFYNPTILINRFALPQKVYDSLLVGCPVFINSEVEMSKDLKMHSVCVTAGYFDVAAISRQLNYFLANKNSLFDISNSIASYRSSSVSYDQVRREAVELYKSFMVASQSK